MGCCYPDYIASKFLGFGAGFFRFHIGFLVGLGLSVIIAHWFGVGKWPTCHTRRLPRFSSKSSQRLFGWRVILEPSSVTLSASEGSFKYGARVVGNCNGPNTITGKILRRAFALLEDDTVYAKKCHS